MVGDRVVWLVRRVVGLDPSSGFAFTVVVTVFVDRVRAWSVRVSVPRVGIERDVGGEPEAVEGDRQRQDHREHRRGGVLK